MQVGVMAPQGWKREFDGWDPADAWARTVELARDAERLGFESIWVFDHFHTVPSRSTEMTLESFSTITALAMVDRAGPPRPHGRVHRVPQPGPDREAVVDDRRHLRRPLRARHRRRLEGGRVAGLRLRLPAARPNGWPPSATTSRSSARCSSPGRATFEGEYASVRGAINEPKGIQKPRIPIIVGGNGRNVTFRYAAQYADEINLVFLSPDGVAELLPIIRSRCEEIDRDPATLRVSLYSRDEDVRPVGQARVDTLGAFAALGLDRIVVLPEPLGPRPSRARLASPRTAARRAWRWPRRADERCRDVVRRSGRRRSRAVAVVKAAGVALAARRSGRSAGAGGQRRDRPS